MLVILYSRYKLPLNNDYSEPDEYVQVTGRLTDISETSSGYKYDINNVDVIHGTGIRDFEHLLVYSFSNGNFDNSKLITDNYVNKDSGYKIGNVIKVYGKAKPFEHPGNPGQFNAYSYYRGKGYAYQIQASRIVIIDRKVDYYADFIHQISLRISDSFYKTMSEKDAGMMSAIILGTRTHIDHNDKELYQDNGLMHLLAVSALHVSMIAAIILWIIGKMPVSYIKGRLIVIVFLCMYGSIAGFGVSCMRAIIMIICSIIANMTGRTYDNISALSLSGIIILLYNPTALFNADYQLSFAAVIAINISSAVLKRINISSKVLSMFVNSLGVSIGICVCTMPIILMNYYDLPLYSSLLNLLILPLMPVMFVSGFCSGVLGGVSGLIECMLNENTACNTLAGWLADYVMEILFDISEFLAGIVHYILDFQRFVMNISIDSLYQIRLTGCPGPANIIVYYVILAGLIIILYILKSNCTKALWIVGGIVILCIIISYQPDSGELKITALDVGQGDGIYIEYPDNTTMFIDGGSSDVSSLGKYRIQPFLYYKGRRSIDIWLITHGDNDHYSGFLEILDMIEQGKLSIGEVWLADVSNPGDGYIMIEERLNSLGIPIAKLAYGCNVNIGECRISCLNPLAGMKSKGENEYSVVLLCRYKSFSALLTGDLEGAGEELVYEYFSRIKQSDKSFHGITLLKVPHHGSANSLSEEFVGLLNPWISIISYGKGNRYGHPAESTIEKLEAVNSRIYDTVKSGAVTVLSDGDRFSVIDYYCSHN